MGFRIGPRLRAAFVVGVPKHPRGRIVEVLVINQHLLCRLVVCVPAVPKHLAIAREEWQRHKNTVGPELPLATLRVRMPEPAVLRARVSVEDFANTFRRELVFLLLRFLVENQQKISRHHEIQGVDGAIDLALVVDMQIRSEEHTSELQSQSNLVCRLLLEKKKKNNIATRRIVKAQ